MPIDKRITLAITGASGSPYALTLLRALLAQQQQVYLLVSDAAREVMRMEMGETLPADREACEFFFRQRCGGNNDGCGNDSSNNNDSTGSIHLLDNNDWSSAPASGSGAPRRMVICPCSMGTLAAVACGLSNNLIERAADVAIKEQHQLVLLPREMPLSALHLEHMLRLAKLGVTVMPPCPGFYHQPRSVQDMVDFVVDRVLKHVGLSGILPAWGV